MPLRAVVSTPGQERPLDAIEFQDGAFSRNHGLLTIDEQDRVAQAVVAIPGLGGVGGQHLISLARCGFRRFRLADPDSFELANFNRQFGATVPSIGRSKLDVMSEQALAINPHLEIERFPEGVTEENLETFLRGVDVVVDSLDFFAFAIRRRLFMRAHELGIPVVTAGPLGFSTAMLVFSPRGMSFDQYFDIHDGLGEEECYLRFAMGLSPRGLHFRYIDRRRVSLKRRRGPSSYIACQACAAVASMEAVRLVLGRPGLRPAPAYLQFDPYLTRFCAGRLLWGNRNPLQQLKLAVARKFLLARGERIGFQPPAKPEAKPVAPLSDDVFAYLVSAAVAAPSGDNAQPWKFTRLDDGLGVRMDASVDRSFFNFRQSATLISCGAAAENAAVAARGLGVGADVRLPDTIGDDGLVATVSVTDDPREELLADALWDRCTNRQPFRRTEVSSGLLERIEAEARGLGCALHVVHGPELKTLARLVFQADRIRTEHRGLHEHFMSMVRFDPEEARSSGDGLPLKNLYGGLTGEIFLKQTRAWRRMEVANALGLGRIVALHSAQAIRRCGAVCLLTAPGFTWRDFVTGGRALERCWLKLTALGLAMQPMTAVTLFRLRWDLEGPAAFSPRHQVLLGRLWPEFDALFPRAEFSREGQIMLFRIGHAASVRHGTYRKPVEAFLDR